MRLYRCLAASIAALFSIAAVASADDARKETLRLGDARWLGSIEARGLDELSGLEPSFHQDDLFWAHNDHSSNLYALDSSGKHIARVDVTDTRNEDWEDMTSFQINGESYLLLADTGGNKGDSVYDLVCVKEPVRDPATGRFPKRIEPEWTVHFEYEQQAGRVDCEAVAVDARAGLILLLTKPEDDDDPTTLYSLPLPTASGDATATRLGTIDSIVVATAGDTYRRSKPTSLDIRDDGEVAVVLTYRRAYAFVRESGEAWLEAFRRRPTSIELPRMLQPEALCFDRSSESLIVTSERRGSKDHAPVYLVPMATD